MDAVTATTELIGLITPHVTPDKIGEDEAGEIIEKIETLQKALASPKVLNVERREINNFDDWEERVFDVVEIVRPDNTIAQIKIQSLTSADHREIRHKRNASAPIQPQPRDNGKGNGLDLNDPHYKKDMVQYERDIADHADLSTLWVIERGLVDIEIPGETDEEKLANLRGKVVGDLLQIGQAIHDISNLSQESLQPFMPR